MKKTMRDALTTILIEVIIFALAYAAKVDVNEINRETHIVNRWLKKGEKKKKTAKPKGSTNKPPQPIPAKCGAYNLGIVSLWDTSDACMDNCLEKTAYTLLFSNICEYGTIMKVCNKDFIKVSYYENSNCTGEEFVANITKETQCTPSYYDNSPATYWNWKCVNSI
jgi:hypothetical protein